MTSPFIPHGHGIWRWTSVGARQLGDELRERPLDGREQLEQVREARDGVVAGQELREDVAAADGAGEDDAVLRRRLRERLERRRRADDLEAGALDEPVDLARDRHRERELAAVAVRADQPEVEQERELDRHLARLLVDQVEPLARAVEDGAEVGADRGDEPLRLADRRREPVRARLAVARERVRRDDLDAERAEHERQHVRRRREAVVDDDAEAALADRLDVRAC